MALILTRRPGRRWILPCLQVSVAPRQACRARRNCCFSMSCHGIWPHGNVFACQREGVTPDLMCVAKVRRGYLPVAATRPPSNLRRVSRALRDSPPFFSRSHRHRHASILPRRWRRSCLLSDGSSSTLSSRSAIAAQCPCAVPRFATPAIPPGCLMSHRARRQREQKASFTPASATETTSVARFAIGNFPSPLGCDRADAALSVQTPSFGLSLHQYTHGVDDRCVTCLVPNSMSSARRLLPRRS